MKGIAFVATALVLFAVRYMMKMLPAHKTGAGSRKKERKSA